VAHQPAGRPVVVGLRGPQLGLLDFADGLAGVLDRPLRVIHAWEVPPAAAYASIVVDGSLEEDLSSAGQEVLDGAETHLGQAAAASATSFELVRGWAPAVLGAESHEATAVVVGTDDVDWLDRLTGEAVTNFLCLHARGPVVVVPPTVSSFTVDEVVACVDGRTAATGPLRFAFQLADRAEVPLRVLHVTRHLDEPQELESARLRLAEVLAGWSQTYPDLRVTPELVQGDDAADAILGAASEGSLLVAGQPHGGALRRWRAPVVRDLEGAGRFPVAVVPDDHLA
jgi:nucleotide-binding universal stress UspA family protein